MPISQKDFAAKLREKLPELKEFSDNELVNKVLSLRPDLVDKIENPLAGDAASAQAQQKAEDASKSLVDPSTWQNHPIIKQFIQSVSDSLPMLGGLGGGLLASPETLGAGSIAGGALGAGAGRGLRDILNQALGTENTSPIDKAKNIGVDTALTAITPGLLTALRYPINTARLAAGSLSNVESKLLPRGLQMLLKSPILDDIASGGSKVDKSAWGALQPRFAPEASAKPDFNALARDPIKAQIASDMNLQQTVPYERPDFNVLSRDVLKSKLAPEMYGPTTQYSTPGFDVLSNNLSKSRIASEMSQEQINNMLKIGEKPNITNLSRDVFKAKMAPEMYPQDQLNGIKVGDVIRSGNEHYQLIGMENGKPKVSIVSGNNIKPSFEFDPKTNKFSPISLNDPLPNGSVGTKGAKLANENLPNDFQIIKN